MPWKPGQAGNTQYQFKPGQSGNPGGVSKYEKEARKLAQEYGVEAVERLLSIMRQNKDISAARLAANDILDRAFGKPKQTTDIHVAAPPVRELTDDDLCSILVAAKAARERDATQQNGGVAH